MIIMSISLLKVSLHKQATTTPASVLGYYGLKTEIFLMHIRLVSSLNKPSHRAVSATSLEPCCKAIELHIILTSCMREKCLS
jgi:hypothetical protein